MKAITKIKNAKEMNFKRQRHAEAHAGAFAEPHLIPISITGVVVPSKELGTKGWERSFRLAGANGVQYKIEADIEWRSILARYKWEEVKVVGLLNRAKMAIILQKLFPIGPNGSGLSMADFAVKGVRRFANEIFGDPGGLIAACAAPN